MLSPLAACAAWVATNYSSMLVAEAYVLGAVQSSQPVQLGFFTCEQAAEVEAMAAQSDRFWKT